MAHPSSDDDQGEEPQRHCPQGRVEEWIQVAQRLSSTPEVAEANLAELDASISAPPEWLHGKG